MAADRLAAELSCRDRQILASVARVRVLSGRQIERLYFADLPGAHRDRRRRRVLIRLVSLGVLATLKRRVGGVRAGSAGLLFGVGPVGLRMLALEANRSPDGRTRYPGTPTDRFLNHSLAVAELYVGLTEAMRAEGWSLVAFHGEPACWWRDSDGEWIKPDAYAVLNNGKSNYRWAIEVDMATESLPTLKRKLLVYLDLDDRGESGPGGGVLPRVLISVPDRRRLRDVRRVVAGLPSPPRGLFTVALHELAVSEMGEVLRE